MKQILKSLHFTSLLIIFLIQKMTPVKIRLKIIGIKPKLQSITLINYKAINFKLKPLIN